MKQMRDERFECYWISKDGEDVEKDDALKMLRVNPG